MRKFIARMVHVYDASGWSIAYKYFMILVTIASLLPLTVKQTPAFFRPMEWVCLCVFVVDLLLRWITADYKLNKFRWTSFARFPFRFITVIDIIVILALANSIFRWFPMAEYTTVLTVFRIIRLLRYSKSVRTILDILQKSRKPLAAVGTLAVGYIIISAIIIFNVEPETFDTFFDAVYWATVSLTTVGYGDLYPVSLTGRVVAMVSSFLGIAIVALPAGIVTAEYTNTIKEKEDADA